MRILIPSGDPTIAGDGAYNMALDKLLFEGHAAIDEPLLRFYCFHPATITVPIRYDGEDLCRRKITESKIKVSRRISGGKYLLHQLGITYSIFLPKDHLTIEGLSLRESYRNLSLPILSALRALNKSVEFLTCAAGKQENKDCSMETEVESMGIQGAKFVGAAQKRGKHSLIQHGEIQLLSSPIGLGHFLNGGLGNPTVGLDANIDLTNIETSNKIVCQPEPADRDNLGALYRLREIVASNILVEFEKVLGDKHYYQLESTLVDRAMEFRKEFEIVLK